MIDSGVPAEALLTAALNHGADLLVVGSCGHSCSVAREVIRRSTRPVLIERIEPTETGTAETCAVVCEKTRQLLSIKNGLAATDQV